MRATPPILILALLVPAAVAAQVPEKDLRNVEIRHTDFEYETPTFENAEAWRARAASLRKQILMAAGLLPLPDKTPLNAEVFGRIEGADYTIEKALLETRPGFETAVFAYTTDIPLLSTWGTPLLLGPGSIHVAHTDHEFVAIDELHRAVTLYEELATALLAE